MYVNSVYCATAMRILLFSNWVLLVQPNFFLLQQKHPNESIDLLTTQKSDSERNETKISATFLTTAMSYCWCNKVHFVVRTSYTC